MPDTYLDPDAIAILEEVAKKHPLAREWMPVVSRPADLIPEPAPWSAGPSRLDSAERHLARSHGAQVADLLRNWFVVRLFRDGNAAKFLTTLGERDPIERWNTGREAAVIRSYGLSKEAGRFLVDPSISLGQLALAAFRFDRTDASRIHMALHCFCVGALESARKLLETVLEGVSVQMEPYAWSILSIVRMRLGDMEGTLEAAQRSSQLKPQWASAHATSLVYSIGLGRPDAALESADALDSLPVPPKFVEGTVLRTLGECKVAAWRSDQTRAAARAVAKRHEVVSGMIADAVLQIR